MSVNKNARRTNKVLYLKKAQDLHVLTIKNTSKLKNTYKNEITDAMLQNCNEIERNLYNADSIYLHQYTSKDMFLKRKFHLNCGIGGLKLFRSQLEILWRLIKEGDDRLGAKEERDKTFQNWAIALEECTKLVYAVIQSDESRWKNWHPSKHKESKNLDKEKASNSENNSQDQANNETNSEP